MLIISETVQVAFDLKKKNISNTFCTLNSKLFVDTVCVIEKYIFVGFYCFFVCLDVLFHI